MLCASLQFPRVLMSGQVDSVSFPTPNWAAATEEYVPPSNGAALPNPMHFSEGCDDSKQGGGAGWLVEILPHCMMLTSEACDSAEAEACTGVLAALEKQIQGLFQEVLGKKQVSTTGNFFAEGGSQDQVMLLYPRLCARHLAMPLWRMSLLLSLLYTARGWNRSDKTSGRVLYTLIHRRPNPKESSQTSWMHALSAGEGLSK